MRDNMTDDTEQKTVTNAGGATPCSPYEIPVIDYTEMNQRTRLEWEVKAAYNRPSAPELPQDFIDYVVDRILELKEENQQSNG